MPPQSARVAVVGAGGSGLACVLRLVMLGVAAVGIVDDGAVAPSDVAPHGPFAASDLGLPRARAVADRARAVVGVGAVRVHPLALTPATAALLDDYDAVVDATSSRDAARLLADEAEGRRIPVLAPDLGLTDAPVPSLSADALEARLAARARGLDDFTLLDVRERPERDVQAIAGSVAAAGFGSTSALWPALPAGSPVVVVGAGADRAGRAARILRARGFDVSALDRGMTGWNLRASALADGGDAARGRVPLPLADIDPEGFRPNLHS